jgi:hypothetical protein
VQTTVRGKSSRQGRRRRRNFSAAIDLEEGGVPDDLLRRQEILHA